MASVDFKKLFNSFPDIRIGVIGDVMLDTYWWGSVERISPEAPVPVVTVNRKELRIGGAGNVALNLAALGTPVSLFSVLGKDEDGEALRSLLEKNRISTGYLMHSEQRITTNKMRVISRNQQMMRLDSETVQELSADAEAGLLSRIGQFILDEKPAALIFEDYNKGVLTPRVIRAAIDLCRKHSVVTAVDPKRKHFFDYSGVDIFKPNLKEAREALNLLVEDVSQKTLDSIDHQLRSQLHHAISLITLSEKGVYVKDERTSAIVPSHIRDIADVSGAGDTVIAVATLIFAVTKNTRLMAEIANLAGGLVCESVGTVAIERNTLLEECERILDHV
jgi:rfaE bifunctional protein kinase chain/domain